MRNIGYLLYIMFYYFIESIIISVPLYYGWKFIVYPALANTSFTFQPTYSQWVVIIWTIKIALFDLFKLTNIDKNIEDNKVEEN